MNANQRFNLSFTKRVKDTGLETVHRVVSPMPLNLLAEELKSDHRCKNVSISADCVCFQTVFSSETICKDHELVEL